MPQMGYVPLAAYGGGMWVSNSNSRHGRLTIWQPKQQELVGDAPGTPDVVIEDEKPVDEQAQVEHKA